MTILKFSTRQNWKRYKCHTERQRSIFRRFFTAFRMTIPQKMLSYAAFSLMYLTII